MPSSTVKRFCRETPAISRFYLPARDFLWRSRSAVRGYQAFLAHGRPDRFIHFPGGIGDDLLCTVLCRELKKRGAHKLFMISKRKELFDGNRDVDEVIQPDKQMLEDLTRLPGKLIIPHYHTRGFDNGAYDSPPEHILALMCRAAGIAGEVELRPKFYLSEEERKSGAFAPGQIAIQSSGSHFPTKNWFPERFQQVVDAFREKMTFIQIGGADDPRLEGTIDQRGNSFRETASILHNSRLFLGLVGFFMHLARAVECPSAIVYGGRESPWQGGYSCNENLVNALPCSPCWHAIQCDHEMKCMNEISVADAIGAVGRLLARPRGPLAVDRAMIR